MHADPTEDPGATTASSTVGKVTASTLRTWLSIPAPITHHPRQSAGAHGQRARVYPAVLTDAPHRTRDPCSSARHRLPMAYSRGAFTGKCGTYAVQSENDPYRVQLYQDSGAGPLWSASDSASPMPEPSPALAARLQQWCEDAWSAERGRRGGRERALPEIVGRADRLAKEVELEFGAPWTVRYVGPRH